MVDFHNTILKEISNYKLILRKTMPTSQCASKMRELGIKRKHIREADEIGLYKIGLKIIGELRKYASTYKDRKSNNFYHGTLEFLQYLEELFANYRIEGKQVIHVGQKASCALVAAIQLITLSQGKLTESKVQQIMQYGNIVGTYGNKEQKKMLLDAINEHQKNLPSEFPEMISSANF